MMVNGSDGYRPYTGRIVAVYQSGMVLLQTEPGSWTPANPISLTPYVGEAVGGDPVPVEVTDAPQVPVAVSTAQQRLLNRAESALIAMDQAIRDNRATGQLRNAANALRKELLHWSGPKAGFDEAKLHAEAELPVNAPRSQLFTDSQRIDRAKRVQDQPTYPERWPAVADTDEF
jgi:hypothetical protein